MAETRQHKATNKSPIYLNSASPPTILFTSFSLSVKTRQLDLKTLGTMAELNAMKLDPDSHIQLVSTCRRMTVLH